MTEPFIFLCPEVTREYALALVQWLKDEEVRKYLSDPQDVSSNIEQVINRVNLPVLTHFFNRGGRFLPGREPRQRRLGWHQRCMAGRSRTSAICCLARCRARCVR